MQELFRQNAQLPFNRLQRVPPVPAFYRVRFHVRRAVRYFRNVIPIHFILIAFFLFGTLTHLALRHHLFVRRESENVEYEIGVARVNITPTEPVWLSGFSSRNHTPHHVRLLDPRIPLYARALSIRRKDSMTQLVLVSIDVIAIPKTLSSRIYQDAQEKHGLSRAALRICATHTHSGPVVGTALAPLSPTDPSNRERITRYEASLERAVNKVISKALKVQMQVTARYVRSRASLAVNRRQVRETNFGMSEATEHVTVKDRGTTDDGVPVLTFLSVKNSRVMAGIFSYAAHATVLTSGYAYSGDYPGVATFALESRFRGATWLFIPGAGGDQNIYPRGTPALLARHAETLALTAGAAAVDPKHHGVAGRLGARHAFVHLPFAMRYSRHELHKRARIGSAQKRAVQVLLSNITDEGLTPSSYPFPVAVWRIGGLTLAFLGGEPTVGYSHLLRHIGIDWVVGYAEDVMGYVGTQSIIRSGGREGGERSAWYYGLPAAWSTDAEGLIIRTVRGLLSDYLSESA